MVGCWSSSVRTVSAYGLDDRAIEVRSPAKAKDLSSSLRAYIGSGAHSASCPMGTEDPFPGSKARLGRDADQSPHLLPMSLVGRSYTSSPLCLHRCVVGLLYILW
jgi:hypothetical protein